MKIVLIGVIGSCKAYIDVPIGEAVSRFRATEPTEWLTKDGKRGVPVREFDIAGDTFDVYDINEKPTIEDFIEC